jgi:Spy/CpxP family protein refolding chaperone
MRKLLLSALVLTLTAPMAFAAPEDAPREGERPRERRAEGERGPRGGGPMGALSQLDLSDEQKSQIKAIYDGAREDVQAWREANAETLKKLMGDLRAAREAKDEAAAETARAELKKLHDASPMAKVHEQVLGVLTDEQKTKLAELRENREDRPRRRPRGEDKEAPVEG